MSSFAGLILYTISRCPLLGTKCVALRVTCRLLDLIAEDNAHEDTIYHLGRAFNMDAREPADLERFLKVGVVSRNLINDTQRHCTADTHTGPRAIHASFANKQDTTGASDGEGESGLVRCRATSCTLALLCAPPSQYCSVTRCVL